MREVVWTLTKEETEEIKDIFERRVSLENLSKIVDPENEKLYEKLVSDYGKVLLAFNTWWEEKSQKYQWKGQEWAIDFQTNEVYITV